MHGEPGPDRSIRKNGSAKERFFHPSYCLIHKVSLLLLVLSVLTVLFGTGSHRDYTHGLITTAIYVLPVLRTDTEDAAIASNCVLNTGAFRDDAEFIHT